MMACKETNSADSSDNKVLDYSIAERFLMDTNKWLLLKDCL